jgi:integrase
MKAKREHLIPLSGRAVEILRHAQALGDGAGLVFPGTKVGKALSELLPVSWTAG